MTAEQVTKQGIRERALLMMQESKTNTDGESGTLNKILELTPLRDLPLLEREVLSLMNLIACRRRIQITIDGNAKGEPFIPTEKDGTAAVKLSEAALFEGIDMLRTHYVQKRGIAGALGGAEERREIIKLSEYLRSRNKNIEPGLYSFFAKTFNVKNEVEEKIHKIYEAIQFCYAMYENGVILYEKAATPQQRDQGELMVRMAQVYAVDLKEIMAQTEANMTTDQLMPGLGEELLAQRLAELKNESRKAFDRTLGVASEVDGHQYALAVASGDVDELAEEIDGLSQR